MNICICILRMYTIFVRGVFMWRVNVVAEKKELKRIYPEDYWQTLQKLKNVISEINTHEKNIRLKEDLKKSQFENKFKVQ